MTRARAKDGIADPETALYSLSVQGLDRDRRNAEGTPISREGQGFAFVPGPTHR